MYKTGIQLVNEPYKVAEYIHYVYLCSYKDICVIPLEHLDYIAGDYLTYKTFIDALQEAEESYSLKIHRVLLMMKIGNLSIFVSKRRIKKLNSV